MPEKITRHKTRLRIGAGAGYGGDRFEPAEELVEHGNLDYLVYECLAERTIALYQQERLKNPGLGYNPQLERRLAPVLEPCCRKGIKIITNMGAANPRAALDKVSEMAAAYQLKGLKVAAIIGDEVLDLVRNRKSQISETGEDLARYADRMISANAYLGCEPLVQALQAGADVILTGRVADPSLFLAPLVYEFGWSLEDYPLLGQGTVVGHLLECAGQVTGGYFADPGYKEVPKISELGFPIAEVDSTGSAIITKTPGSGGIVSLATCKEQLLYEIQDPAAYYTPDCVADFSRVRLTEVGLNRVQVHGGRGAKKPAELKVSIGYRDSFVGEGEVSYAGAGAIERGRLAAEIVRRRLEYRKIKPLELRFDLIGVESLHLADLRAEKADPPYEVRLRVAARTASKEEARLVGEEVETLWTNGPAGGGGARYTVREVIGIVSTLLPREEIQTQVLINEI